MTNRQFLETYRSLVLEVNSLEMAADRCQSDGAPSGIHSLHIEHSPATNTRHAASLQLYEGLTAQIKEKREQLENMGSRFWSIVHAAPNPQTTMIMAHYYGMGEQDNVIASIVGYTREHVNRLRNEYIKQLA